MRCLERNKKKFFYALYEKKIPMVDGNGHKTGEYEIVFSKPVAMKGNISSARGKTVTRQFGEDVSYDRVIVLDNPMCPINEHSILWIDTKPVLKKDGSTDTPHDYVVTKVAPSINSTAIAVSKVVVRG